jgi:hypothetical protein
MSGSPIVTFLAENRRPTKGERTRTPFQLSYMYRRRGRQGRRPEFSRLKYLMKLRAPAIVDIRSNNTEDLYKPADHGRLSRGISVV